jgi:hypothetical protein
MNYRAARLDADMGEPRRCDGSCTGEAMPPKDIREVLGRMIPEDERLRIRGALLESYKPQHLAEARCGLCGDGHRPLALHVCDFYEDRSCPPKSPALLIGENSIGRRWSLPVCTDCAPPCPKCELPIVSAWVGRSIEALQTVPWGRKAKAGLGVCRHFHPIRSFMSRSRKPYWTVASLIAEGVEPRRSPSNGPPSQEQAQADQPENFSSSLPSPSSAARSAMERQLSGWDLGEFGGMAAFTRYHEQPSGFRLRVSLFPAAGHRINLFAAIVPPPDELNCDRQLAIDSVRDVQVTLGSDSVDLADGKLSLLGQHGIQLTGWFVFTDFLQKLVRSAGPSGLLTISLRTVEPYTSQLGGRFVVVPTDGLFEGIKTLAEQIARSRG